MVYCPQGGVHMENLYVGSGQASNGNFGHEIKGLFVMELAPDMLTIISEPTIIMPADFPAGVSHTATEVMDVLATE